MAWLRVVSRVSMIFLQIYIEISGSSMCYNKSSKNSQEEAFTWEFSWLNLEQKESKACPWVNLKQSKISKSK
jgi:hypothetical protein